VLKGEKVLLRAVERADLPRLHAFNNDVAIELAGGGDPPMPQSLARLEAEFDQEASKGGRDGAGFAIEALAPGGGPGTLIGQCALFQFDHVARTCALGITIGDKAYWSRGYGRDAVRVLLDYAFRLRNLRKVWLTVWGNNERAIRCYRACGFIEEGRLRDHVWSGGAYVDLVHMSTFRPGDEPKRPEHP
jgi:RimJ/RimL family protein N-acetyltransferase